MLTTAPREGHEQSGYRPYIVLSHQVVSTYSNVAIVAPISTTQRNYPLYISISDDLGMKTTGKVLLDQLTTIDYVARDCSYVETAHEVLVDELLMKVRAVFQKN